MADGEGEKKENLKVSVWDGVKVRDVLTGMDTMQKEYKVSYKWLLGVLFLMMLSSGICLFLNGILGFILTVVLGLIGIKIGFRITETITKLVRVVREVEKN